MVDVDQDRNDYVEQETEFSGAFTDAMSKVPGQAEPSADELRDEENSVDDENSTDVENDSSDEESEDPNAAITKDLDESAGEDYKLLYEQEVEAHNKEKQRNKSWEGRISAANSKAKDFEEKANALAEELTKAKANTSGFKLEFDTEEAKELMSEFDSEYPDLKRAIVHIASAVAKEIALEYINQYMPDVKPLEQKVERIVLREEENEQKSHLQLIIAAHPDAPTLVEGGYLRKWILKQPSHKQSYLTQAYEHGNTQEVIDLIQDFKDSTGWVTQGTQTQQQQPTNTPKKSGNKDSKLQQQLAVSGDHTPLEPGKGEPDQDDFSSAFAVAAKKSYRQ